MDNRISSLDTIHAFAVSVVVLYHLKVTGFSFGYLGVDLFFLLSGFLMTYTMLTRRKKGGKFKIGQFFVRRFRRIAPSLLIVILLTSLATFALMSPDQLANTLKQGFFAQFFLSNILFFDQSGYFAPENEVRALLHTWSLSVEEQFYLFFALLLAVGNMLNFIRLCLIVTAFSLVLLGLAYCALLVPSIQTDLLKNEWQMDAAIFFLPPFRLIQFIAGVLVGIILFSKSIEMPKWLRLAGLAVPIIGFITLQMVPNITSLTNLIVVICFIPLFFNNPILSQIGRLTPIKFIARISYQVYLTHWPIIVLWRYWTFQPLNA